MLQPLDKMKYTLYCLGEGWFYAKKFDEDTAVWKKENNAFEQGIERMLNNDALKTMGKEKDAALQNKQSNNNQPTNNTQLNNNLARFQRAFNLAFIVPFQTYTQGAQQTLNRMAQVLSHKAADILRALGIRIKSDFDTEEDLNQKEEMSDVEAYADEFVRRSQASSGQSGL